MASDDNAFHFHPDLFQLLVQALPLLCRSKNDVLLFFRGCGLSKELIDPVEFRLNSDRSNTSKYYLARELLTAMNAGGDESLRPRRELIRRVVQFEDFSSCWPDDQLKAKGLVSDIRRVVKVKDSFTRMAEEREKERTERASAAREQVADAAAKRKRLGVLRDSFLQLFAERNPQRRGLALELVVNDLFEFYEISVRKSFKRVDEVTGRVLEQIDGVIELDGHYYLVEMKWLKDAVSVDDVSRHLCRVYPRAATRALFIADTEFSPGALDICKSALHQTVVSLVSIHELVRLLEQERDLKALLRKKIEVALLDRQPWHELLV